MRPKCETFCWRTLRTTRAARGLTLVEVLAGTALLGTLLVGILMARSRLAVQSRRAEATLAACNVLDDLLEHWWNDDGGVPRNQTGVVPGSPQWRWRTQTLSDRHVDSLDADIVVVELFGLTTDTKEPNAPPAATVELLLGSKSRDEEHSDATDPRPDAG